MPLGRQVYPFLNPNPTVISASGASPGVFSSFQSLWMQLTLSAVPTGGTPTLDVYFQGSADGGTVWRDMAHVAYTTTTNTQFIQISAYQAGAATLLAASDGALAANTVLQGPFAPFLRLKWVFAAGGSTGTYSLAAWKTGAGD